MMPRTEELPAQDALPAPVGEAPPAPIEDLHTRIDPIVYGILSQFCHEKGYKVCDLWDFRDRNTPTQSAWQLTSGKKDVPPPVPGEALPFHDVLQVRVDLNAPPGVLPHLVMHYWGINEAEIEELRIMLVGRTGLPVTPRPVPETDPIWKELTVP